MCFDRNEMKKFYEFQLDNDEWDNYGSRTNLDHVCNLVRMPEVNTARILDLGCGDGDVAQAIAKKINWSQYYLGIDAVPKAVQQFNDRMLARAIAIEGEVANLSLISNNSIDLVLCLFLVQDICRAEGERLIEEVARVLTPDG